MQKMTSAYANKMLRSLEEDKNYWLKKESESSTYVAAVDEEPVIPDYDYATVAATIAEIDAKMAVIKPRFESRKCNREGAGWRHGNERGYDPCEDGAVEQT